MGLAKYFATRKMEGKAIEAKALEFFGEKKKQPKKKKEKTVDEILKDLLNG